MIMGLAIVLGFVGVPINQNVAVVWLTELVLENLAIWGVFGYSVVSAAFSDTK